MEQLKVEDFLKNSQLIVAAYGLQDENDQNSNSRRLTVSKFRVGFIKGHYLNTSIYFVSNYTKTCRGK